MSGEDVRSRELPSVGERERERESQAEGRRGTKLHSTGAGVGGAAERIWRGGGGDADVARADALFCLC